MKNKRVVLAALLMITMVAFSVQTKAQKGYSFNVNAMVQNSWLFNSDDSDMDNFSQKAYIHPALSIGAGYNFTEKLGMGLDVMYSFQGRKQEVGGVETRIKLDYVKIPLYFHFNT
ncbi:MAG TPA: outer membrane beta-barrel protein, partial [Bacteroidales bacterium]|nr:outer membrane beta-barrel protein [Bacteroidales bacterium]HPL33382.1 outer membrane beta-barrel protein [Bacteroidales bacterium]